MNDNKVNADNYYKEKCSHCDGHGYVLKSFYRWQKGNNRNCEFCQRIPAPHFIRKWNSTSGREEDKPACEDCFNHN